MRSSLLLTSLAVAAGAAACDAPNIDEPSSPSSIAAETGTLAQAVVDPEVFASGLRAPRGFTWGPDGSLYVAEAGLGGPRRTRPTECEQVAPPIGPYTNGLTSRISKITPEGRRSVFVRGLPSARDAMGNTVGAADLAFLDGELYALSGGGGCSHGIRGMPAAVIHVSSSGEWRTVVDLSAYIRAHPIANPAPDFEFDGAWYSMVAVGGRLFIAEANHGEVVRVNPDTWRPSRVTDVSARFGHIVPTALAERRGTLYLGNLGTFPIDPRSQRILQVRRNGDMSVFARGFTTVLGLDFDDEGRMYVLEMSREAGFPTPGLGRVIRVNDDGSRDVVVNRLSFPTAMRFGPDGWLYISNRGFGPEPGEILRADVGGADAT